MLAEIDGQIETVMVTHGAIAGYLDRPVGKPLMVEESSDFLSTHRKSLIEAANASLANHGKVDGKILLFAGDIIAY